MAFRDTCIWLWGTIGLYLGILRHILFGSGHFSPYFDVNVSMNKIYSSRDPSTEISLMESEQKENKTKNKDRDQMVSLDLNIYL